MEEKRGPGRPPIKFTAKHRKSVEQMRACGETQETIAASLGISIDSLQRHFSSELVGGAARRRKEIIDLLFDAARKGNVTAQKHLAAMTAVGMAEANILAAEAPPKMPKQGKKEAAQKAAESAGVGTDWGDDLHLGDGCSGRPN